MNSQFPISPLSSLINISSPYGGSNNPGVTTSGGMNPYGLQTNYATPLNTAPNITGNLQSFGNNPASSSLSQLISSLPQFQSINAQSITAPSLSAVPAAYQAQDTSKMALPQYDAMREQINSQYSQTQSQAQDALDRQFAAMGGGPGNGAQAKQTENLASSIAKQKGQDLMGINAQEAQTRTQLQQIQQQEAFQSGEQQRGQEFQQGLTGAQMGFGAQQFNAGQNFAAQQFNQQMQQQQNQFNFGANSTIAGLNMAWQQANQQALNDAFNAHLGIYQALK